MNLVPRNDPLRCTTQFQNKEIIPTFFAIDKSVSCLRRALFSLSVLDVFFCTASYLPWYLSKSSCVAVSKKSRKGV